MTDDEDAQHAGYYRGHGPGRCPVCGWHLRIDGHAPRCTRAYADHPDYRKECKP